jgi:hypothetical protein
VIARASLAAALLAAGCADQMVPLGTNIVVGALVPPIERQQIDVLFVADTSSSMQHRQDEIAARAATALGDVIAASIGGPPDLHVGVITSDMGTLGVDTGDANCATADGGRLQHPAACTQLTAPYLADAGDGADVNYTGPLADALGCLIRLETNGCGFEQPFAAVEAALVAPENAGFLRPDAQLVVIFLSDEDDCSAVDPAFFGPESATLGPVDSYRCFANTVACAEPVLPAGEAGIGDKTDCAVRHDNPWMLALEHVAQSLIDAKGGDATKVMVAAFAGPTEPVEVGQYTPQGASEPRLDVVPSCIYIDPDGVQLSADPAPRLAWLLDRFAGLAWGESLCESPGDGVERTARVIGDAAGRRACLRGTFADTDPTAPGLQPDCRAYFVTDALTAAAARTELRRCDDTLTTDTGCFAIVRDDATCGHWLGLEVELRGLTPGGHDALLAECVIPDDTD